MDVDTQENTLTDWLALLHTPTLGPVRLQRIKQSGISARDLLDNPGIGRTLGLPDKAIQQLKQPDWQAVERDLRWAEAPHHHILSSDHPDYPPQLKQLPDLPPILFVNGQIPALKQPQLAIVGSRNPSVTGRETAHSFASSLAQLGLTITSGLALGIDAASHQGALDASGITLAITGCGPDKIYPARHRDLAKKIIEQGALITEFPIGTPPKPEHFPRRNRIISGLSLGTLVVEAAPQSGSLITARHALEQNREVFAIPGSIHNPMAKGCHALIRDGAILVENIDDIIRELAPQLSHLTSSNTMSAADQPLEKPSLDPHQHNVMTNIGFEATTIDTIIARCGLTAEQVSSILLTLELKNLVTAAPGGAYLRVS